MRIKDWRRLAACLAIACLPAIAAAAAAKNFIAPGARKVPGGRDVHIVVAQTEIMPSITVSHIAKEVGGGLLWAMIDLGVNNERAQNAEKAVVQLREALTGFDFDTRVEAATARTLTRLGWVDPKQVNLSKDISKASILAALDAAGTDQLLVLIYTYETDVDYSGMIVSLKATLVNKAIPKGKKPDARLKPRNLAYFQGVRSMVRLQDHRDPAFNRASWSVNGGEKARDALTLGIERCQQLAERVFMLSAAEAASYTKRDDRPLSTVPDIGGWVVETLPTGQLIYDPALATLTQVETYVVAAPPEGSPAVAAAPADAAATSAR
jgi:hypothetical protein